MNANKRRASYDAIFFESFGVEHIRKKVKKFLGNKNIINIYGIRVYKSIMWTFLHWICGFYVKM